MASLKTVLLLFFFYTCESKPTNKTCVCLNDSDIDKTFDFLTGWNKEVISPAMISSLAMARCPDCPTNDERTRRSGRTEIESEKVVDTQDNEILIPEELQSKVEVKREVLNKRCPINYVPLKVGVKWMCFQKV